MFYVGLQQDKGSFIINEAIDLPEGYSYGYNVLETDSFWLRDGEDFNGNYVEIGQPVLVEGNKKVQISIVKDNKIVRFLTGIYSN